MLVPVLLCAFCLLLGGIEAEPNYELETDTEMRSTYPSQNELTTLKYTELIEQSTENFIEESTEETTEESTEARIEGSTEGSTEVATETNGNLLTTFTDFVTRLSITTQLKIQEVTQLPSTDTPLPSLTQTTQIIEEPSTPLAETLTQQPEIPTQTTSKSCEMGFTGTFPDCTKIEKKQKCRRPSIGVHPDCFIPPCPPRYSGTYPKCEKPTDQICPFGSVGVFPHCEVQLPKENCTEGSICDAIVLPSTAQSPAPTSSSSLSPTEHPLTDANKIEWEDFKRKFNKTYIDPVDEQKRHQTFLQTRKFVEAHNRLYEQGIETYTLAINEFSDRTYDEYHKIIESD